MGSEDKGSEATTQMLAEIGGAITQWSFVEDRLCTIFLVCTTDVVARAGGGLDFGNASVGTAVFFSAESFRGKLAMTDAAVRAYIHEPGEWANELQAEWGKLKEKTRKLSLKRNWIAHYTVLPGYDYEGRTVEPRLVPPVGSPGFYKETGLNPGSQTISLKRVHDLGSAFCILEQKLRCFAVKLASQEELFDRYARRTSRRIRQHAQQSQSRADTLRRALPSPDSL